MDPEEVSVVTRSPLPSPPFDPSGGVCIDGEELEALLVPPDDELDEDDNALEEATLAVAAAMVFRGLDVSRIWELSTSNPFGNYLAAIFWRG